MNSVLGNFVDHPQRTTYQETRLFEYIKEDINLKGKRGGERLSSARWDTLVRWGSNGGAYSVCNSWCKIHDHVISIHLDTPIYLFLLSRLAYLRNRRSSLKYPVCKIHLLFEEFYLFNFLKKISRTKRYTFGEWQAIKERVKWDATDTANYIHQNSTEESGEKRKKK